MNNFTFARPNRSKKALISITLAKRILPCPDVTGRSVVKGVNLVELRDTGDQVEMDAQPQAKE